MNNKPNNPPAFPLAMPDQYHPEGAPLQQGLIDSGMALRDYFAAHASKHDVDEFKYISPSESNGWKTERALVEAKYAYADAMLAEREKGGQ